MNLKMNLSLIGVKSITLYMLIGFVLMSISSAEGACNKILIDDVAEMAFGESGALYTGEVKCFYGSRNKDRRYVRYFENGISVSEHFCYSKRGEILFSIVYKNGKRIKRGGRTRPDGSRSYMGCFANGLGHDNCQTYKFSSCF